MRQAKKPTVAQRKLMQKFHMDWTVWLVVSDSPTEMVVRHRQFDQVEKIVPKKEDT